MEAPDYTQPHDCLVVADYAVEVALPVRHTVYRPCACAYGTKSLVL